MTAESLAVPLLRENVLHFLGYRGRGRPASRTEEALESALEEARRLIVPRGVRWIVPAESANALGLERGAGLAAEVALGLVTIGPALESRVSELLGRGEDLRALLLDAAGSAAAEEAAEELERRIHEDRQGAGDGRLTASRRVSPGYGSWPVTAQRALFGMLPHDEIDVRLLPSCIMSPRKSVSFAVWLGAGDREECRTRRCSTCDLMTCPYREETGVEEES